MGAVLGTTLGVAFAAIDLPPEVIADPGGSVEELVSTGGSDLPDRIREAFAARAADRSGAEAAALLAEGEVAAERTASLVKQAFVDATRRIYWLTAGIMALATVLAARVPELPLRTTHDRIEATRDEREETSG